jgi:hypothetical protein
MLTAFSLLDADVFDRGELTKLCRRVMRLFPLLASSESPRTRGAGFSLFVGVVGTSDISGFLFLVGELSS